MAAFSYSTGRMVPIDKGLQAFGFCGHEGDISRH